MVLTLLGRPAVKRVPLQFPSLTTKKGELDSEELQNNSSSPSSITRLTALHQLSAEVFHSDFRTRRIIPAALTLLISSLIGRIDGLPKCSVFDIRHVRCDGSFTTRLLLLLFRDVNRIILSLTLVIERTVVVLVPDCVTE